MPYAFSQDATDIVGKTDQHSKGKTSVAELTIQTIRPNWKREMNLKTWTRGNDLVMILVIAPVKDRGITFLKNRKEFWNWIPGIERHIKLPPSMMSQSWMGTDFTNNDLVKESSVAEDYHYQFAGDSVIEQRSCYKINMKP